MMSTTIAKKPTRLEALERRCEELEESQGLLSQKLVELAQEEEKVRYQEVQKAPLQSPESATGPVGRIRRKRAKTESELEACERNLNTARQVLTAEREKAAAELLSRLEKEARSWNSQESELWKAAGDVWAEFHRIYTHLVELTAQRAAHFSEKPSNRPSRPAA
jgi:hypothetical protein